MTGLGSTSNRLAQIVNTIAGADADAILNMAAGKKALACLVPDHLAA